MTERVLVVPRRDWFGGDWPQGFVPLDGPAGATLAARMGGEGRFVDREPAESDPSLKQPIPYCVVTCGDAILVVQRRPKGTESRLHGLYSVGIGGHINPEDGAEGDPGRIVAGLRRELTEELAGLEPYLAGARLLGVLNDDSNPVGRVHVGLVYRLSLPAGTNPKLVEIREISKLSGGFRQLVELRDLWQDPGRFETWSRIVLEAVFNLPSDGSIPHSSTEQAERYVRQKQYDGGTYPDTEP